MKGSEEDLLVPKGYAQLHKLVLHADWHLHNAELAGDTNTPTGYLFTSHKNEARRVRQAQREEIAGMSLLADVENGHSRLTYRQTP